MVRDVATCQRCTKAPLDQWLHCLHTVSFSAALLKFQEAKLHFNASALWWPLILTLDHVLLVQTLRMAAIPIIAYAKAGQIETILRTKSLKRYDNMY